MSKPKPGCIAGIRNTMFLVGCGLMVACVLGSLLDGLAKHPALFLYALGLILIGKS